MPTQLSKRSRTEGLDWPLSGYYVILAVCWPLISLQLVDALWIRFFAVESDGLRGLLLRSTWWIGGLVSGAAMYYFSRRGLQGLYLAAFGIIISILIAYQFRSEYIRVGTFDAWQGPPNSWLTPLMALSVTGAAIGTLFSFRRPLVWNQKPIGLCVASLGTLIVLTAVSFYDCYAHPRMTDSMFAATRPYVLTVTIAFCFGLFGFAVAGEPS